MTRVPSRAGSVPQGRSTPSVRQFCAGMSPAERFKFFAPDGDGRKVFDAHICHQQRKVLKNERKRVRNVTCSVSWHDAAWHHGQPYPPGGDGTGMVLSETKTSFGDGPAHARWTPPQCVVTEDALDRGDKLAIKIALQIPSPSAIAIHRLQHYNRDAIRRLADDRGKIGRGRAKQGEKVNRV